MGVRRNLSDRTNPRYDDLGRWEYLVNDNVIAAPTPYSDKQLFRIYKREKSDDEVTVYARHIYYDNLGNYLVDVRPTNKNGQQALDIIFSGTKFTPHSDITTANTAYYVRKNIVEAIAGDDENSFINRWGGNGCTIITTYYYATDWKRQRRKSRVRA